MISYYQAPKRLGLNPDRDKKTLDDFFPSNYALGKQSYPIPMLMEGTKCPHKQGL